MVDMTSDGGEGRSSGVGLGLELKWERGGVAG